MLCCLEQVLTSNSIIGNVNSLNIVNNTDSVNLFCFTVTIMPGGPTVKNNIITINSKRNISPDTLVRNFILRGIVTNLNIVSAIIHR